jgi:hypothetical protein
LLWSPPICRRSHIDGCPGITPFCFPILLVSVLPCSKELDDIGSSSEFLCLSRVSDVELKSLSFVPLDWFEATLAYHLELRRRRQQLGTLSNSLVCCSVWVFYFVCLSSCRILFESQMCNCCNWNVIYMASILCMCWSRNTTSMADGVSFGRHGVVWPVRDSPVFCVCAGAEIPQVWPVGRVLADTE